MKIFSLLFILLALLHAKPIDFTHNSDKILQYAELYIDANNLDFQEITKSAAFIKSDTRHINLGFVKNKVLWIKLEFYNKKNTQIQKILEIYNPLLESVTLYVNDTIDKKGMLYADSEHKSLNRIFSLELQAKESQIYYLKVENSTTALRLGVHLKDKITFLEEDYKQQLIVSVFFSILVIVFAYNLLLFFYTKENSYLFYCLYLTTLVLQQATYLGISQIYLPQWLIYYDNLSVVLKVNLMYITAAFFAKSFLQTKNYELINKTYNAIIIVALIEIPLVGSPSFYYPEVAILTGFLFVLFNIFASSYIYRQGDKQARFFVIGWSFLVVGFVLMIFDGLGVINVMYKMSNLIIFLTALEAIVLSLAFTDRYNILKEEKERSDSLLVKTMQERQKVIEQEIDKQTKNLNRALEKEKILLKELQHRTKNNLQLILSILRMQSDSKSEDVKKYSKNLEYRINAIAKMHQMLHVNDDLQQINMDEYMGELSSDLENLSKKDVIIKIENNQVYLPFKEAGYIGLILNELITNSIKYTALSNIVINIDFTREHTKYKLVYKDNGGCYDFFQEGRSSMGIKLIKTLVQGQLEGTIIVKKKNGCTHIIEFTI